MAPKIVLSGYYGFHNAGDEAMLLAILKGLRTLYPEAELTVLSGDPFYTVSRYGVESVHYFALWKIWRALRSCNLFISGGGSLLQDVTSIRSLLYYLGLLAWAHILGKKVMLFAQGIGPVQRGWLRSLTAYVVKKVDVVTVRDDASLACLTGMGVPEEKIIVTADAVFTLQPNALQDGKILLSRIGMRPEEKIVAVAIRSWQEDRFLGALVDALDNLADQGYRILLLPLQYPMDLPVARKLQGALRHDAKILDRECTTAEFLSVLGNVDLLVGMRLHALVFAAVMGIPFVALEYDPKITGFVSLVQGVSAGNVSSLTTGAIMEAVVKARHTQVQLENLRSRAFKNCEIVKEVLERS